MKPAVSWQCADSPETAAAAAEHGNHDSVQIAAVASRIRRDELYEVEEEEDGLAMSFLYDAGVLVWHLYLSVGGQRAH